MSLLTELNKDAMWLIHEYSAPTTLGAPGFIVASVRQSTLC